ncbi:MAG TPA: hypothetical protein VL132_13030, partial [Planctomycetaceae bacterium]|nr:hypothetical protein [Planctomycetaceae bacterium]
MTGSVKQAVDRCGAAVDGNGINRPGGISSSDQSHQAPDDPQRRPDVPRPLQASLFSNSRKF